MNTLITINYLAAFAGGFALLLGFDTAPFLQQNQWMPYGVALGILFTGMFFLIGNSAQKAGIAVTTLANKLSLVFPVFFSLWLFDEPVTILKYMGLIGTFAAIGLTVFKKDAAKVKTASVFLPLIIFLGSGLIDSLIKYVQATRISEEQTAAYSTFVFFVAFVCGVFVSAGSLRKKGSIGHLPTWVLGIALGTANFGSLYFFIKALNHSNLESSMVFALNNITIVVISALTGAYVFNEKLSPVNRAGIAIAIPCLYILLR